MRGLYFYKQQQYDSALTFFLQIADYPRSVEYKCYNYTRVIQCYTCLNQEHLAYPYAEYIAANSSDLTQLSNAYYTLMNQAEQSGNTELVAIYAHARADVDRKDNQLISQYGSATEKLSNYLAAPPTNQIWGIIIGISLLVCGMFGTLVLILQHRKQRTITQQETLLHQQDTRLRRQTQIMEHSQDTIRELRRRINTDRSPEIMQQIAQLRKKYPQPDKSWKDYDKLKMAVSPTLLCFCDQLEKRLSEKEIEVCVYCIIYDNATLYQLADYLHYSPKSIRTVRGRIARKLNLDNAANLRPYLLDLAIVGTPAQD